MKLFGKNGCAAVALAAGITSAALIAPAEASITFSTFVAGGDILAAEGQEQTIGFNFAGNKFVGSVYNGTNNLQLYSTDLNGKNVKLFGSPLPEGGGEPVLAGSLGLGGFAKGDVYASASNKIYHYANSGGSPTLFGTLPTGNARQIFFDPTGTYGGAMIVTTTSGDIYTFNSGGTPHLLASVGADTEGIDIASSNYGSYAGDLLVASEGSGLIHAITPTGTVLTLPTASGGPVAIPEAETVSVVPLNFGKSGDSLEGFYVANFPVDIQKAGNVSEFKPYLGDAIVTSEFGSSSPVWDIAFNGSTFSVTQIGTLNNQSEDGIFVTSERIVETGGGGVPEPTTWAMLLVGIGLVGFWLRQRRGALVA